MIYLDHNATTPLLPSVYQMMKPYFIEKFGNSSRVDTDLGMSAYQAVEQGRVQLASLLGVQPKQIVFVSGGTESCFQAIVGACYAKKNKFPDQRKRIVTTAVEHPAVDQAITFIKNFTTDFCSTILPVNKTGELSLENLENSLDSDTFLISAMLANNETGVLFPIEEICKIAHRRGIVVHCDAVQAVGKMSFNVNHLGVDLLSLSGHKFGGPKGIGALVILNEKIWQQVMPGGGQQDGRRGGTEPVALIAGLGEAARVAQDYFKQRGADRLSEDREWFENELLKRIPGTKINGAGARRLANTTNVMFQDISGIELAEKLGKHKIIVGTGSACKSSNLEPSQVLSAMGKTTVECLSSIRISFPPLIKAEEIKKLLDILEEEVYSLRQSTKQILMANLS